MPAQDAPPLTPEVLVERLALRHENVADEVYAVVRRAIDADERRDASLNQKATALLSVTGLSLTLAFTFGGLLLKRAELASGLGGWLVPCVVVPYACAILFGLVASGYALWALLVRGTYRDIDPHEVFGPQLRQADETGDPTTYKRHMIAHLWCMYDRNYSNHEKKAAAVKWGQFAFFAFIVALLPIGGAMTFTIAQRSGIDRATASAGQPTESQARARSPEPARPGSGSSAQPAPNPVPSDGRMKTLTQTSNPKR